MDNAFSRVLLLVIVSAVLLFSASKAAASNDSPSSAAQGRETVQTTFLPVGDLFKPLIADLKQPRFFISYHRYRYSDETINISSVGVGESFGLYRAVDTGDDSGWQVSFEGGLLAQFNLDTSSKDLLNTDYFAGVPISYRTGALSWRANLYHQSSHLGDEYLLHATTRRVEFSYEALNVTGSYELHEWRGYLGGEVIFRKEPHDLKTLAGQAGIEYYGSSPLWGRGVPVGGIDLKIAEEHDWAVNTSVSAGLEFRGDPPGDHRYIRFMLDGYAGFNPHGQFYTENMRISYYGVGVYWGF